MIDLSSYSLVTAFRNAPGSLIEGRMQAAFAPQGVLIARLDRDDLSDKGRRRKALLDRIEQSSDGRSRITWLDGAEPSAKGRFEKRFERTPAPGIAVGAASALRQGHRIVENRVLFFCL